MKVYRQEGKFLDWNTGAPIHNQNWTGPCVVFIKGESCIFETGIDPDEGERFWRYIKKYTGYSFLFSGGQDHG